MDRTIATRALAAAFAIGGIAQALLVEAELGINVLLLVAATMVGGRRVPRDRRSQRSIRSTCGCRSPPWSSPRWSRSARTRPSLFLNVVTAAVLLGASMAAFAGAAVTRRSALAIAAPGHGRARLGRPAGSCA